MIIFKDRRIVKFVKDVSGGCTVIASKKISPTADRVTFKNLTFAFDVAKPSYRVGRTFIYLVDVKNGQLQFHPGMMPVSARLMQRIMVEEVVSQLVAGLKKFDVWNTLLYLIMGLGMGIPLGYILGNFVPIG